MVLYNLVEQVPGGSMLSRTVTVYNAMNNCTPFVGATPTIQVRENEGTGTAEVSESFGERPKLAGPPGRISSERLKRLRRQGDLCKHQPYLSRKSCSNSVSSSGHGCTNSPSTSTRICFTFTT